MRRSSIAALGLAVLLWAGPGLSAARAHEFWISPDVYTLAPGAPLVAEFRVGEGFKGATRSYFPANSRDFRAGPAGALAPVTARLGDRPALNVTAQIPGLYQIVYESDDTVLVYKEWGVFRRFADQHDLAPAPELHIARGLPQTGFRESYRRHCKALVAVGDGAGRDSRVGLDVEIVLETNPYTMAPGAPVLATLYRGAKRHASAQLEVHTRLPDGTVTLQILRSDAAGRVAVPSVPGSEVLLNFVVLSEVDGDPEARQPVWHSDWASLTYAVPAE